MTTECIVIQIGNSDDKLTQKEWSAHWNEVRGVVHFYATETHFRGCSDPTALWQNACWVVVVPRAKRDLLFDTLRKIATKYRQDSIAVMIGQTEFLTGESE